MHAPTPHGPLAPLDTPLFACVAPCAHDMADCPYERAMRHRLRVQRASTTGCATLLVLVLVLAVTGLTRLLVTVLPR